MSKYKDSDKALDKIIQEMITVVSNSKQEIFEIGEESRKQQMLLEKELEDIKKEVIELFDESEMLERKLKKARFRLIEVSKNFDNYSEAEVREVYNYTHEIQTQLIVYVRRKLR